MEKCNMWKREMMWKKLNNVNEGKSRRNCNQQIKKREQAKSCGKEWERESGLFYQLKKNICVKRNNLYAKYWSFSFWIAFVWMISKRF